MSFSTLFFIGNGFDIAAGYKTSYSNFYASDYFKKLIKEKNPIALYVEGKKRIQNWADLEQELFNFAKEDKCEELGENFELFFKQVRLALYLYILSVEETWLRSSKSLDSPLHCFLRQLYSEDNNIGFISFNYTSIFDDLWEIANGVKPSIQHVHGRIKDIHTQGDNIVLGIDETMKVGSGHNFLYKSFNDAYDTYNVSNAIKNAKRIIIFGCSMGDSDRWYFEQIFKNCSHKVVEIITHGDKDIANCTQRIRVLTKQELSDIKSETQLITFDNTQIGNMIVARKSYYEDEKPYILDSLKEKSSKS